MTDSTEKQTSPEKKIKVFLAVWPDTAAREKLGALADQLTHFCGGRKTNPSLMHLTLVFIGYVDNYQLVSLRQIAGQVKQSSFDLTVDKIAYWRHNRIVHAGLKHCPAELLVLVNDLQARLSKAGFSIEKRSYIPHITLVRKALRESLPNLTTSISWRVNEWALVQSKQTDQGTVYISLDRWRLDEV